MEAEQLFDELYAKSVGKEHVTLRQVGRLKQDPLDTFPWPTAVRIIREVGEICSGLDAELTKIATTNRMRVRRGSFQCPYCNNKDCPDAVFVPEGYVLLGPKDIAAFLAAST